MFKSKVDKNVITNVFLTLLNCFIIFNLRSREQWVSSSRGIRHYRFFCLPTILITTLGRKAKRFATFHFCSSRIMCCSCGHNLLDISSDSCSLAKNTNHWQWLTSKNKSPKTAENSDIAQTGPGAKAISLENCCLQSLRMLGTGQSQSFASAKIAFINFYIDEDPFG